MKTTLGGKPEKDYSLLISNLSRFSELRHSCTPQTSSDSSLPLVPSTSDIELLLTAIGVLDPSTVPGNSTNPNQGDSNAQAAERAERAGEDEDEGFGGNRNGANAGKGKIRSATVKSQEEEDAELDWDL